MSRSNNPSALDLLFFESMGETAHEKKEAEDSVQTDTFGVKSMHCRGEADKLLEYVAEQVEARPWSIIFSATRRASVLAFPTAWKAVVKCLVISVVALASSIFIEKEADEALTRIDGTISAGLFFLLGPYVGLCVARWWQMRIDLLGGVWGAAADLNMYAAIWFNSGSPADLEARQLNLRYGLAAHALLYLGARGVDDLDELVQDGILLPSEAMALDGLPSKSQMVFTWLAEFWNKALSDDGGLSTSRVPHAAMFAPAVIKRCMDGRGAAGGALALVYTQLPFPYVHLLSLLVEVACVVNGITVGVHTGTVLSEPVCLGDAIKSTGHKFRYEIQEGCPPALFVYSWCATSMILAGWFVTTIAYPVIYHGLLSIGIMVSNPLGEHFIDLPGQFYSHVMKAECKGFHASADACNASDRSPAAPRGIHQAWWAGCRSRIPRRSDASAFSAGSLFSNRSEARAPPETPTPQRVPSNGGGVARSNTAPTPQSMMASNPSSHPTSPR